MKKLKGKKGFTLIEVIVILAVIAILAAVLTPMIIGYISDARTRRAQSDVKIIASAVLAFNKDMKDWPIWVTNTDRKTPGTPYAALTSGDGDIPTGTIPTPLGSIDEQLMTNVPVYPGTGGSKWVGPYLETVKADPWGNKYYIDVVGLQPNNLSSFKPAYVVSAGPNKKLDTASGQSGPLVTIGDDDIVFRIK